MPPAGRLAVVGGEDEAAFQKALSDRNMRAKLVGAVSGLDYSTGHPQILRFRTRGPRRTSWRGQGEGIEVTAASSRSSKSASRRARNEDAALDVATKLEFIRRLEAAGACAAWRRSPSSTNAACRRWPALKRSLQGAAAVRTGPHPHRTGSQNERPGPRWKAGVDARPTPVVCATNEFGIRNRAARPPARWTRWPSSPGRPRAAADQRDVLGGVRLPLRGRDAAGLRRRPGPRGRPTRGGRDRPGRHHRRRRPVDRAGPDRGGARRRSPNAHARTCISTTPATRAWPTPSPASISGQRCWTRKLRRTGRLFAPAATGNIATEDLSTMLARRLRQQATIWMRSSRPAAGSRADRTEDDVGAQPRQGFPTRSVGGLGRGNARGGMKESGGLFRLAWIIPVMAIFTLTIAMWGWLDRHQPWDEALYRSVAIFDIDGNAYPPEVALSDWRFRVGRWTGCRGGLPLAS